VDFFFGTQGDYIDNSPVETSTCKSQNKVLDFGTKLVMMTGTTSLDEVANLTKLIERLSTSL
jgi:hypothetical protein